MRVDHRDRIASGTRFDHEAMFDGKDCLAADGDAVLLNEEIDRLGDAALETVFDRDDGDVGLFALNGASRMRDRRERDVVRTGEALDRGDLGVGAGWSEVRDTH